jgi:hypothetical protein
MAPFERNHSDCNVMAAKNIIDPGPYAVKQCQDAAPTVTVSTINDEASTITPTPTMAFQLGDAEVEIMQLQ